MPPTTRKQLCENFERNAKRPKKLSSLAALIDVAVLDELAVCVLDAQIAQRRKVKPCFEVFAHDEAIVSLGIGDILDLEVDRLKRTAELSTLDRSKDFSGTFLLRRIVIPLCEKLRLHFVALIDVSTVDVSEDLNLNLRLMHYLTRGQTWYEAHGWLVVSKERLRAFWRASGVPTVAEIAVLKRHAQMHTRLQHRALLAKYSQADKSLARMLLQEHTPDSLRAYKEVFDSRIETGLFGAHMVRFF